MKPGDKKNKKDVDLDKEQDDTPLRPDEVPSEDVDMIREKNNPFADNQYNDDNSYGDDR